MSTQNNASNVYTATPEETAAVSRIKQMINGLLDATKSTGASPALRRAPTSKQPRQNQTFIHYIFESNTPPRKHPVKSWGFVRDAAGVLIAELGHSAGPSKFGLAGCNLKVLQLHGEAHVPRDLQLPLEERLRDTSRVGGLRWGHD